MAYTGIVSSFRTVGAGVNQNLFTLENGVTTMTVTLRRLVLQMDATVTLQVVMPQLKCARTTALPTGGTTLTKGTFDSTQTSSTLIVARGATASDGGAATAITATPGTVHWQQFGMRISTAVGQISAVDCDMLPVLIADASMPSFTLRYNEAIVVYVSTAVTTSNPATNHYWINCVWQEA